MPTCLSELPNDAVHEIALNLSVRDYTSLGLAKKCFAQHLDDDGTARKVIKANHSYCWAGLIALNGGPHFRRQLARLHYRREALRTARPYTISHIATATSFAYTDGILAYTTTDSIRLLDVSRANTFERVISNRFITSKLPAAASCASAPLPMCTILAYRDNILALLATFDSLAADYLIALDVSPGDVGQRCLLSERLRSTNKLFCVLGDGYLYYGTQSASSGQGYPEWLILGFCLNGPYSSTDSNCRKPVTQAPLQLDRLSGLDPSSTITFTIHKGHFIALTNQTGYEAQEVNWTSYYRYVSIPLDDPHPDLSLWRVFRRQDHEGPINDTWTELKWTVDEATGGLILVEGRKEWLAGHDGCVRTWYSILWDSPSTEHALWDGPVSTNPNDRLSSLVTADSQGRDECGDEVCTRFEDIDVELRPARYCHREYPLLGAGAGGESCQQHHNQGDAKEYIRAKTKFSSYDFNRGCAVELVVDDVPGDGDAWRTKERLRLRVVSRRPISPLVPDLHGGGNNNNNHPPTHGAVIQRRTCGKTGSEIEGSEERYADSEIRLWPPTEQLERQKQQQPAEVAELMCPGGRAGDVKGMLGEEGLVYSVGAPGPAGEKQLVFVCFDPAWGFEGMRRLDGGLARPRRSASGSFFEAQTTAEPMDQREVPVPANGAKRKFESSEDDIAAAAAAADDQDISAKAKRQKSESPPDDTAAAAARARARHDSGIALLSEDDEDNDNGGEGVEEQAHSPPPSQHGDGGDRADASPMLSSEPAMYQRLNRGFWLR